jgi:hypothetical protein
MRKKCILLLVLLLLLGSILVCSALELPKPHIYAGTDGQFSSKDYREYQPGDEIIDLNPPYQENNSDEEIFDLNPPFDEYYAGVHAFTYKEYEYLLDTYADYFADLAFLYYEQLSFLGEFAGGYWDFTSPHKYYNYKLMDGKHTFQISHRTNDRYTGKPAIGQHMFEQNAFTNLRQFDYPSDSEVFSEVLLFVGDAVYVYKWSPETQTAKLHSIWIEGENGHKFELSLVNYSYSELSDLSDCYFEDQNHLVARLLEPNTAEKAAKELKQRLCGTYVEIPAWVLPTAIGGGAVVLAAAVAVPTVILLRKKRKAAAAAAADASTSDEDEPA